MEEALESAKVEDGSNPKFEASVVVLAKSANAVKSTVAFLNRRGIPATQVKTLNEAIELLSSKKANVVLLSLNFPHPKIEMIPTLLAQSFTVETIVFAEDNDRKTQQRLSNAKSKHVIMGPVSGPTVMMRVRSIEKTINGDDIEAAVEKERTSLDRGDGNDDIKVGGGSGKSGDQIVLKGQKTKSAEEQVSSFMKSLSDASESETEGEGLERSGETIVQKGRRSKMMNAREKGFGVNRERKITPRELQAAIDRGLLDTLPEEVPPLIDSDRASLIEPEDLQERREAMELAKKKEQEEYAAQEALEKEADKNAKALKEAKAAKEKQAAETDKAQLAQQARETAKKEAAEREQIALEARERRAQEREEAKKATKEKNEAQAREKEAARAEERAREKAEREQKELAAAEAKNAKALEETKAAVEAMAAKESKGSQSAAIEKDALAAKDSPKNDKSRAGSAGMRSNHEQGEAGPTSDASDEKNAATSGEKAAQSPNDNLGSTPERSSVEAVPKKDDPENLARFLREAVKTVCGENTKAVNVAPDRFIAAGLVSVSSANLKGGFLICVSESRHRASDIISRIEVAFFSILRQNGHELQDGEQFAIGLDDLSIVKKAFVESEMIELTCGNGHEVAITPVNLHNPVPRIEPHGQDMFQVKLEDIAPEVPVNFGLYLYLRANKRYLKYLKPGSSMSNKQFDKLENSNVGHLYLSENDQTAYRRHYAAQSIQPSPRRRKAA